MSEFIDDNDSETIVMQGIKIRELEARIVVLKSALGRAGSLEYAYDAGQEAAISCGEEPE